MKTLETNKLTAQTNTTTTTLFGESLAPERGMPSPKEGLTTLPAVIESEDSLDNELKSTLPTRYDEKTPTPNISLETFTRAYVEISWSQQTTKISDKQSSSEPTTTKKAETIIQPVPYFEKPLETISKNAKSHLLVTQEPTTTKKADTIIQPVPYFEKPLETTSKNVKSHLPVTQEPTTTKKAETITQPVPYFEKPLETTSKNAKSHLPVTQEPTTTKKAETITQPVPYFETSSNPIIPVEEGTSRWTPHAQSTISSTPETTKRTVERSTSPKTYLTSLIATTESISSSVSPGLTPEVTVLIPDTNQIEKLNYSSTGNEASIYQKNEGSTNKMSQESTEVSESTLGTNSTIRPQSTPKDFESESDTLNLTNSTSRTSTLLFRNSVITENTMIPKYLRTKPSLSSMEGVTPTISDTTESMVKKSVKVETMPTSTPKPVENTSTLVSNSQIEKVIDPENQWTEASSNYMKMTTPPTAGKTTSMGTNPLTDEAGTTPKESSLNSIELKTPKTTADKPSSLGTKTTKIKLTEANSNLKGSITSQTTSDNPNALDTTFLSMEDITTPKDQWSTDSTKMTTESQSTLSSVNSIVMTTPAYPYSLDTKTSKNLMEPSSNSIEMTTSKITSFNPSLPSLMMETTPKNQWTVTSTYALQHVENLSTQTGANLIVETTKTNSFKPSLVDTTFIITKDITTPKIKGVETDLHLIKTASPIAISKKPSYTSDSTSPIGESFTTSRNQRIEANLEMTKMTTSSSLDKDTTPKTQRIEPKTIYRDPSNSTGTPDHVSSDNIATKNPLSTQIYPEAESELFNQTKIYSSLETNVVGSSETTLLTTEYSKTDNLTTIRPETIIPILSSTIAIVPTMETTHPSSTEDLTPTNQTQETLVATNLPNFSTKKTNNSTTSTPQSISKEFQQLTTQISETLTTENSMMNQSLTPLKDTKTRNPASPEDHKETPKTLASTTTIFPEYTSSPKWSMESSSTTVIFKSSSASQIAAQTETTQASNLLNLPDKTSNTPNQQLNYTIRVIEPTTQKTLTSTKKDKMDINATIPANHLDSVNFSVTMTPATQIFSTSETRIKSSQFYNQSGIFKTEEIPISKISTSITERSNDVDLVDQTDKHTKSYEGTKLETTSVATTKQTIEVPIETTVADIIKSTENTLFFSTNILTNPRKTKGKINYKENNEIKGNTSVKIDWTTPKLQDEIGSFSKFNKYNIPSLQEQNISKPTLQTENTSRQTHRRKLKTEQRTTTLPTETITTRTAAATSTVRPRTKLTTFYFSPYWSTQKPVKINTLKPIQTTSLNSKKTVLRLFPQTSETPVRQDIFSMTINTHQTPISATKTYQNKSRGFAGLKKYQEFSFDNRVSPDGAREKSNVTKTNVFNNEVISRVQVLNETISRGSTTLLKEKHKLINVKNSTIHKTVNKNKSASKNTTSNRIEVRQETLDKQKKIENDNQNENISNKDGGKAQVNHIEQILLKYYEEFKNRNTMMNNNEQKYPKKSPIKRKFRQKIRPMTTDRNKKTITSSGCVQSVMNRKYLNSSHSYMTFINKERLINYRSLEYLDLSHNTTFQYLDNLIFLNVSCQNILPLDQKGTTYTIEGNVGRNGNEYNSNSNRRTKSKGRKTDSSNSKQVNNTYTKDGNVKLSGHKQNESDKRYFRKNMDEISNRKSQKYKNEVLTANKLKEPKQSANNRIAKRMKSQSEAKANPLQRDQNQKQIFGKVAQRKTTIQTIPDIIDFKLNLLASISQRLKQFECINVNLNQVPKVLTHSIQILNLKLNKIKIIQLGDFDDYPLLQILILSQNKIKSMETDSLGRLDYLKVLLVDKNKLNFSNVNSYIEHIVSFENGSNYTQASLYYKHIIEEQQTNCLHEGNTTKTKDKSKMLGNTDVNIENYSSMNNSTDVTRGNIVPFMNRRKTTSNNKIFMENSSENNGIFVITEDTDTPPGEYEDSLGLHSVANFRRKHLDTRRFKNMDYGMMNDQAVITGDNKTESSMLNINPLGDENKFSIVRDSKKNVILKLNRNINNETEEKLTENYDQLEVKEPTKINNREDEDLDKEENQLEDNPDEEKTINKPESFPPNTIVHKDAQYEMNIIDTDAEFLDIIEDKTENIINENTIRTLETSKYHELVSSNTTEGMEYHTGMIIFLLIVVFMIVGAFLALTFQWNSLLHSYCHHYVSYRNNGQSDDEANTSDSNFDRIEMLDNVDVYSIT
ncbi:hypothetical protein WDU94_006877 [Cyamophila willieti]